MPTLNWIGKDAVVKHHKEVPFRLLEPVPAFACGDGEGRDSGNLIVQGDNLHALKALLPRYAGQVKCIYIDPPYNTGNEGWVYNDNVNSPEIRKWLGEVVGKEGETLDRHDRWLSMMYPRLVLLKQFLREDGAIFVSIDDNEVATLRLLMDDIFEARNFVGTVIWQKKYAVANCCIPDDHMAACETDPASPGTTASWPASASCCPVLTAAAGGCTRPHSAARSAPYLHGC